LTSVVRAAGGIVTRRRGAEVLLVHRPRYGDWTFPKGKCDPGESDEDCALREVEEETCIRCTLGVELGRTGYVDSRARDKVVRYFAMRPLAGRFEPHDEVDEIAWLPPEAARVRLSYDRDRSLPAALPPLDPPLVFVRHASAGGRGSWGDHDPARPLDERGGEQAARLVDQLAATQVDRVVSSPAVRCLATVAPLAAARGLEVEARPELFEGSSREVAFAFVRELAGTGAVLCSHGDVLEHLLGAMGKKGSTRFADLDGGALRVLLSLPPPA
jgi:8-oxo-dGTP pyrophosphatase MutT (NUDIX family)/phosphohistidine phosphatase SixA